LKKTVLHELLAVEQGLAETANRIAKETTKSLSTKHDIFAGLTKEHKIFSEDNQHMVQATEYKEVQSTVKEQLDFLNNEIAAYWDVTYQKEEANQRANADIVVEGEVLIANVPSIVLLGLEKKLISLVAIYNAIPTLDAATAWEEDPSNTKANIFRTKYVEERQQSVTTNKYIEISPATKEFKAQIAEQSSTDIIGKFLITKFSGTITSYDKAAKLEKLTKLTRAVKKARQRANNTEVNIELKLGKILLDYINS